MEIEKYEIGVIRNLIEKKEYGAAFDYLLQVRQKFEDSADITAILHDYELKIASFLHAIIGDFNFTE